MSVLAIATETLKRMAEAIPVATYTCQACALAEDTDLCLDPRGEVWVCEGCYSEAAELHGYQGAPIYISDLPRLLAEQPAPVR